MDETLCLLFYCKNGYHSKQQLVSHWLPENRSLGMFVYFIFTSFLSQDLFSGRRPVKQRSLYNRPNFPVNFFLFFWLIYQERDAVIHHQMKHQEESRKNTTRSGVFLTNVEVFHLVMKHCVECLTLLLKRKDFGRIN